VADTTDLPKAKAAEVVDAVFSAIEGALKKQEEVRLVGFGSFVTAKRKRHGPQSPHRRRDQDPGLEFRCASRPARP